MYKAVLSNLYDECLNKLIIRTLKNLNGGYDGIVKNGQTLFMVYPDRIVNYKTNKVHLVSNLFKDK